MVVDGGWWLLINDCWGGRRRGTRLGRHWYENTNVVYSDFVCISEGWREREEREIDKRAGMCQNMYKNVRTEMLSECQV